MKVTVVVGSHGDDSWARLASERAVPSALRSGADEVMIDHHPNGTRAQVRNALTDAAAGDYIVTLDADDELAPGYCDAIREMDPCGELVVPRVQYVRGHRAGAPHFLPEQDIRVDNWMVVGTAFPREVFLKVGGWRTLTGTGTMNEADDWDLWARLTNDGCGIAYCAAAVYRAFVDRPSAHRQSGRRQREKWAREIRALNWPNEETQ